MAGNERTVSLAAGRLIHPQLQKIIWAIHEEKPLLPSIFDLRKGQGRYTQHIHHLCLLPYYEKRYTVELAHPLDNIRVTILQIEAGLLMRLSNKQLEELSHKPVEPE